MQTSKKNKILLVERNWKIVRIVDEPEHDVKEVYAAITAVAESGDWVPVEATMSFAEVLQVMPSSYTA